MRKFFVLWLMLLAAAPLSAQITLPDNMYGDSAYAPFFWGIASGGVTSSSVLLWTKVEPDSPPAAMNLNYEVATDHNFSNVVASGSTQALESADYTAQVDISGLNAGTKYWYRFQVPFNSFHMHVVWISNIAKI